MRHSRPGLSILTRAASLQPRWAARFASSVAFDEECEVEPSHVLEDVSGKYPRIKFPGTARPQHFSCEAEFRDPEDVAEFPIYRLMDDDGHL